MKNGRKPEGVAIVTNSDDGKVLSRTIIPTTPEQAAQIEVALSSISNLSATVVYRDFDIFGKVYWRGMFE